MTNRLYRFVAPLALVAFGQLACYNAYTISTSELEKLQSGNIAEYVVVESDEGPVSVRATTPIAVETTDGQRYNVTPFNFSLSESQLVAPDYDLLLARDSVSGARVSEFSKGKTIGLVLGAVAAAAGSFVAITVLAGSDEGPGGE